MFVEFISRIKEKTDKQVIIFPGSRSMISRYADAIYYMMLMNSTNINYIVGHQIGSAGILKMLGIETIPMGYLIFEPGMTVYVSFGGYAGCKANHKI